MTSKQEEEDQRKTSTTTADKGLDDEDKTKGYGTTRHGSHLTKTTEGVAKSEEVEEKVRS